MSAPKAEDNTVRTTLRRVAARVPRLRKAYLWAKLTPAAERRMRKDLAERGVGWEPELEAAKSIRDSGIYPLDLDLTNDLQPFEGRNFLGYPAGGAIKKDGRRIGWYFGSSVSLDGESLPAFQNQIDLQRNFPFIFDRYKPEIILDFGTANGASAVLFHHLAARYCEPVVMSIDLQDVLAGPYGRALQDAGATSRIRFHRGDITSPETLAIVKELLAHHPNRPMLISLDDDHAAAHVHEELELYAPLLRSGDVFLVQDAWNQGLRGSPLSPLLAVIRFLSTTHDFFLDVDTLKQLELPSNFVHGLLVKR